MILDGRWRGSSNDSEAKIVMELRGHRGPELRFRCITDVSSGSQSNKLVNLSLRPMNR